MCHISKHVSTQPPKDSQNMSENVFLIGFPQTDQEIWSHTIQKMHSKSGSIGPRRVLGISSEGDD